MRELRSVNPTTGELIATFKEMSSEKLDGIVRAAHLTWREWRTTPFGQRRSILEAVAHRLRERRDDLAHQMAIEMGKAVKEGRAEVDKCAWVLEHYAENGEDMLRFEPVDVGARRSGVAFLPLGLVLGVMPWNFPLWQVFRFAAPAVAAGNGVLLKHASNVPGLALALEGIWRDAGAPSHLFNTLLVGSQGVERLVGHPMVAAVALTGSTEAGRQVAAAAGRHLKKTVMELGGSDPYLVLEDARIEEAAEACALARLMNCGQSCIAAKRFIVAGHVAARFEEALVAAMERRTVGDPLDHQTDMGPMARVDLRDELHQQVLRSIEAGGRSRLGCRPLPGPGAFYPPSLICDVPQGAPARDEELFGPVGAVITARDEDEAVEIANSSPFGLGAAVFTADEERGWRLAHDRLEAGSCFVNTWVRSDPRLPFGGVRLSGYGRELGTHGIKEFVNVKTLWMH